DAASASSLLTSAELGPLDDLQRARLERLRAQAVFLNSRGSDAPQLLLDAARRLAPLDATLARDTYLEALSSALSAGRLTAGPGARESAVAASAVAPVEDRGAVDLLLDGLVVRFTDGYVASAAPLTQALHAFRDLDGAGESQHWLWLVCRLAQDLWDDDSWF